jgi:flagellar M-ring protein FliF
METMHPATLAGFDRGATTGTASVNGLLEFFKSLGAARLGAMAAVTLALVGVFAFIIVRVTSPQMTPLFTDLTLEDSANIVKELDRAGIAYELKNDGAIVMVPRDKVAQIRMKLAEAGIPKGGGIGYEVFDKSDTLGATSFVQNINRLRALEGELSRSIRTIERVQAARVHLVLPDRPLFSRDKVDASASIVLSVRGTLDTQQVQAIRHLVAGAVSGLKPERVSVVDETGRLLADGAGDDPTSGLSTSVDERQAAYERRLRGQIESIVSSVVGPGHARVQVSAEFDFNRLTETSDRYDPESRVLRSSQTREEQNTSNGREGEVTVGNEVPGAPAAPATNTTPREQSKKSEELVNYEISRTTKTEVVEGGRIKRLAAAVVIDGTYGKADNGNIVYQPRAKEEMDRIAALVRTAVGFDQKRGDQVEVVNLRFAEQPPLPEAESRGLGAMLLFSKEDIMRAAELVVMALLALVVLLVVVRPMVRRIITAEERPALPNPNALAGIIPSGSPEAIPAPATVPSQTAKMIDIAQIKGQVHAQSIQKVGELAQKNPHETVSIIREWLHDLS